MYVNRSALSLVIHKNGDVSDFDIDDLLSFYRSKKGVHIERDIFKQQVDKAVAHYKSRDLALFVCTDSPCLKETLINPSNASLANLAEELNCPVEATGCHWHCENASTVTVKSGAQSKSFLKCSSERKWSTVKEFIAKQQELRRDSTPGISCRSSQVSIS